MSPNASRQPGRHLSTSQLAHYYHELLRRRVAGGHIELPNFVGVGPPRTGTSTIYRVLAKHPEIFMSPVKELNYFGVRTPAVRSAGISLDGYRNYFTGMDQELVRGEISPIYLAQKGSLEEISQAIPSAKILITLRHPVARAISQYVHHRERHGYSDANMYFRKGLADNSAKMDSSFNWFHPSKNIRHSLYIESLSRALTLFSPEQIKVQYYEHLVIDPVAFFDELCEFLEVDSIRANIPASQPSTTVQDVKLEDDVRAELDEFFFSDMRELRALAPEPPW